jgi:hypothetical protein
MGRTKKTLIRADGAGGTKGLIEWCSKHRLGYSVGFQLPDNTPELVAILDHHDGWTPAYNPNGEPRENAYVAELTHLLNLKDYPKGIRVIIRKEHPHPGAQLRFDDIDGYRVTAFATNTRVGGPGGQHADLELRHRRRARVEDRIRIAKDTGLSNLPFHGFNHNQIWLAIINLGLDILAWSQTIGFTDHEARRWEPKRLRLHMFTTPATITRKARTQILHLGNQNPRSPAINTAIMKIRGFHIAIE